MKRGFTLIEMLTVVLVMAVLTAVAVPQYRRSVERARLAEATQMLPAIYDAVDRYYVSMPVDRDRLQTGGQLSLKPELEFQPIEADEMKMNEFEWAARVLKRIPYAGDVAEEAAEPIEEAIAGLAVDPLAGAADAEDEETAPWVVPFSALDLNLKGKVGKAPNVWETPNFSYTIFPLKGKQPFFVAGVLQKGKYKGAVLGYNGANILCCDSQAQGACDLMNLETINSCREGNVNPGANMDDKPIVIDHHQR